MSQRRQEADIDASLLRRVEPFQMVQLVCRAARFWIAFVQSCDPYLPHLKYRWTALRSPYAMITPGRHRSLAHDAWSESAVRVAIEEIAADAIAHFHLDTFWPAHPSDDGVGDGDPSFYKGAAGVIWALDYLHRIGATRVAEDFRPVLPKLMERTVFDHEASSPTDYEKHGSLLRGDMGAALPRPPAETDMQRHFQVSPPSVHQMIVTLERNGLIRRQPGVARSIQILVAPEDLLILNWLKINQSEPL